MNQKRILFLNFMAKIFELLLLDRIKLSFIPRPEQFSFRAHYSTTIQLVNVLHHIVNIRNKEHKTTVALLDIKKAFDKVWHDGLIFKLIESGISPQLVNTIKSFLANRSFHVRIGDHISKQKVIKAGVLQGSYLSPQLFTIFINDMPHYPKTNIALFADDTLIYTSNHTNNCSVKRLQGHLDLPEP